MFFVTTIEELINNFTPDGVRTVGFYSDFATAKRVVEDNVGDINETIYDYAVIEELDEGLYPDVNMHFLYKFNYDTKKYEPMSLSFPYHPWKAATIG